MDTNQLALLIGVLSPLITLISVLVVQYHTKKVKFFDAYFENKVKAYNNYFDCLSQSASRYESPTEESAERGSKLTSAMLQVSLFCPAEIRVQLMHSTQSLLDQKDSKGYINFDSDEIHSLLDALKKDIDSCKKMKF